MKVLVERNGLGELLHSSSVLRNRQIRNTEAVAHGFGVDASFERLPNVM